MNTRSFLTSALIAGVAIGLLGNLPVLNLINCACCVWVWIGGALAVFLYRRYERGAASPMAGEGALLGAVSGFIGALVGVFVFAITSPVSIPMFNNLARGLQYEGEMPFQGGTFWEMAATALIFLMVDAILYPLFGALGGALGALIMKEPAS